MKRTNVLNYFVIAALAVMTVFTACKPDPDEDKNNNNSDNVYLNNPPKRDDVYVVGYEGRYAVTWKNGASLAATDESGIGKTNSIYISGKDVYEVGTSGNNGNVGTLWKNGISEQKQYGSDARSVFVWNNNVYVAGNGGAWKNGEQIISDGVVNSVYVFRGNVYAAGSSRYYYDGYSSTNVAWFWENNVGKRFGGSGAKANCVFVSESGDVYVAGLSVFHETWFDFVAGAVSKNGVTQRLGTETNSVFTSGNDVYVVGYDYIDSKKVAVLWKNGEAQKLSDKESTANCVFVSGGDVYVAGHETVAPNRNRAVLWKNGVAQYLTDGAVDASAMSVFVVE